jgi:hypothetical protein
MYYHTRSIRSHTLSDTVTLPQHFASPLCCNYKYRVLGDLQWHDAATKFCQNSFTISKLVSHTYSAIFIGDYFHEIPVILHQSTQCKYHQLPLLVHLHITKSATCVLSVAAVQVTTVLSIHCCVTCTYSPSTCNMIKAAMYKEVTSHITIPHPLTQGTDPCAHNYAWLIA